MSNDCSNKYFEGLNFLTGYSNIPLIGVKNSISDRLNSSICKGFNVKAHLKKEKMMTGLTKRNLPKKFQPLERKEVFIFLSP